MKTQPTWYRRPALWGAAVACIAALVYAVTMKVLLQGKVEEEAQLVLRLEQEKQATKEARELVRSLPAPVGALEHSAKSLDEVNQEIQKQVDDSKQQLQELQQDERVKAFQEKEPELRALLDKQKELTKQVEEKLAEYKQRVEEARK